MSCAFAFMDKFNKTQRTVKRGLCRFVTVLKAQHFAKIDATPLPGSPTQSWLHTSVANCAAAARSRSETGPLTRYRLDLVGRVVEIRNA